MKKSRIVPWDDSDSHVLAEALAVLRRGALLVLPTDTVYGIAADPRIPGAEKRLYRAKGRPEDKPIALLAADTAQMEQWHPRFGKVERALARRYWPGALTMVLAVGDHPPSPFGCVACQEKEWRQWLPPSLGQLRRTSRRVPPCVEEKAVPIDTGKLQWEGFRIPDHPAALAILRAAGGALRVTSANQSGAPPALTAELAAEAMGERVDLVLDAGPVPGGLPSTVVRMGNRTIDILREGAIPGREIVETCQEFIRAESG